MLLYIEREASRIYISLSLPLYYFCQRKTRCSTIWVSRSYFFPGFFCEVKGFTLIYVFMVMATLNRTARGKAIADEIQLLVSFRDRQELLRPLEYVSDRFQGCQMLKGLDLEFLLGSGAGNAKKPFVKYFKNLFNFS
jgi:hypothetical protein